MAGAGEWVEVREWSKGVLKGALELSLSSYWFHGGQNETQSSDTTFHTPET